MRLVLALAQQKGAGGRPGTAGQEGTGSPPALSRRAVSEKVRGRVKDE